MLVVLILFSCKEPVVPTIPVVKNDETYAPEKVKAVMDEWQRKNFSFFFEGASSTGMALEGNDRGDVITIGGSGFGVMAIIVGTERSWITREQSTTQMQKIVRFLGKAERFKGAWSHWYNPDGTAHPFGDQEKTGDLIETAFMMAGLLAAGEYYTGTSAVEKEIRDSVASFWKTIDWRFYAGTDNALNWLYYSHENRLTMHIKGWNEGLISYILALGAPEPMNISYDVYNNGWLSGGAILNRTGKFYGYDLPLGENYGGPMFFAHYSFLGLNPNLMEDNYANYWKQNVGHTMINRHYCVYAAPKTFKYGETDWGLTACYGGRPPWGYLARSPLNDDGVIAPTAALGSYPYTPFYSTQVLFRLAEYSLVHGTYGFADAYSPETSTSEKKHLAIDQGPIVVMMENYRSGLIWNLLMKNADIQKGLALAGMKAKPNFKEGFHKAISNTYTKEYDMMRHPDRGSFELDYYLGSAGAIRFRIMNADDSLLKDTTFTALAGENVFKFRNTKSILNGKQYTITMTSPATKDYSLVVRLR
ncbi:MAG: glucoamylase family protein [Paludibacter sp.]|nr:glucoamylase family protein [Paludibacter sp.]